MADVARAAGVSIATVSRALRDVPGVSRPTRDRIRRIAHDLSYVISPEASALSRGQTGRVAIVMPHLDAWFYSAMIASMAPVLRAAELDMLVYQVEGEDGAHPLPARAAGPRPSSPYAWYLASARSPTCTSRPDSSTAGLRARLPRACEREANSEEVEEARLRPERAKG